MLDQESLGRIRSLWQELACAPSGFTEMGWTLIEAPGQRLAPPGWVGIIELLGSIVVAAPKECFEAVRARVGGTDAATPLTDLAVAAAILGPFNATLGPAVLFYGRAEPFRPKHEVIGPLAVTDARVAAVLDGASESERNESALDSTTSGVWTAVDHVDDPAAVCGWQEWPCQVAHVSVLTLPARRRRGFGFEAARAALEQASLRGLLPQWRAAEGNEASVATAEKLGLERIGRQLSVQLPACE